MSNRCIVAGLMLCLFPALSLAAETRMLDVRPLYQGPAERTFFYAASSGERDMLDLRHRLVAYGARKIVYFVPNTIVCELPTEVEPQAVVRGSSIRFTTDPRPMQSTAAASGEMFGLEWARQLYATYDRTRPATNPMARVAGEPKVKGESLPWAPLRRSTAAMPDRGPLFNVDLMMGEVLMQMVFPESNALLGNNEEWTDEHLSTAASRASLSILYYQDKYRNTPLNFTVRTVSRVATDFEPIKVTRDDQGLWINDVMKTLGYEDPGGDHFQSVTNFNNAARAQFKTDWVFTAFIVDADNDEDKRFSGLSVNTLVNVGGPYLATPYPVANVRGDGLGDFGQSFKHDFGHIFWALEEAPGPISTCSSRSGYLNTANGNKQTGTSPQGAKLGCAGAPDDCIMNNRDALDFFNGDPCEYTAGQHGSSDVNNNQVPDAVDDFPILDFGATGIDTVLSRTFPLSFKAVSQGVRNSNVAQAAADRVNYAVPVRMVARSENNIPAQVLTPVDGAYDELEEEFDFDVTALPSGLSELAFVTRNMVGRTSADIKKRIFFLGLNFLQFTSTPGNTGNKISWVMFGESFGAHLELHRITVGDSPIDEVIASGTELAPQETNPPFRTYAFLDDDVQAAQKYQYYATGSFDLVYQGELQSFVTTSDQRETTAIIPHNKERVLSQSAPNPFTSRIFTTVFVPELEAVDAGSTNENGLSQSRVLINVYDVAGRLVRTIFDDLIVFQTFVVEWDGTDQSGDRAATGIYFIKANVGPFEAVNKIVLVR